MNIFGSESPEFYLAYNPLECDCRTDWLVKMEDLALSGPYPLIVDMDRYAQYRLAGLLCPPPPGTKGGDTLACG